MYLGKTKNFKCIKKFSSIFWEKFWIFKYGFECANIFRSMVEIYHKVWEWHTDLNNKGTPQKWYNHVRGHFFQHITMVLKGRKIC